MPTQTVSTTSYVAVDDFTSAIGLLLTVAGGAITLRINESEEVTIPDSTTNMQFIRGHRAVPIKSLEVKLVSAGSSTFTWIPNIR